MDRWIYIFAPVVLILCLGGAVLFALAIYVKCAVVLCLWIWEKVRRLFR